MKAVKIRAKPTVYYWVMFCEMCGKEMKKSRQHAFLCGARCRKAFSRLDDEKRKEIKERVTKTSWKPKAKRSRKKKVKSVQESCYSSLYPEDDP